MRGHNRGRVVPQYAIRRPDDSGYHGGYEDDAEGYARSL
jgi:hypothetical protein